MALPIAPTPPLNGQEARKFLKRIEEDQSKPLYLKPTPGLEKIRQIAREKWEKQ